MLSHLYNSLLLPLLAKGWVIGLNRLAYHPACIGHLLEKKSIFLQSFYLFYKNLFLKDILYFGFFTNSN